MERKAKEWKGKQRKGKEGEGKERMGKDGEGGGRREKEGKAKQSKWGVRWCVKRPDAHDVRVRVRVRVRGVGHVCGQREGKVEIRVPVLTCTTPKMSPPVMRSPTFMPAGSKAHALDLSRAGTFTPRGMKQSPAWLAIDRSGRWIPSKMLSRRPGPSSTESGAG